MQDPHKDIMGFHCGWHAALIIGEAQIDEAWYYHAVSLRMDQKDWQTIRHNNTLKFYYMKPLIPILHSSFIRIWPCNLSYSSINKTKAVFQRGTMSMYAHVCSCMLLAYLIRFSGDRNGCSKLSRR